MVEQTNTGWLTVLEKRGLLQVEHILQQYGIGSVTEVSELEPDVFSELQTRGIKTFHLMKLKRWSEVVGLTEMLPSRATTSVTYRE